MKCLSLIEPRYALQAINYVQYKIACLTLFSILQHIFKKFFSGKSESDSCTLYSDCTLKDNKSDPHTAYPADQDILLINLKSRVIAAAISALWFTDKPRQPTKFPLPVDIAKQSRVQRLEYLNKAASLIVDKVVFNYDSVRRLLDDILTNQESQDETDKQERTVGSRFPCGFPGCQASFKYDVRRGRHVSSLMTDVVNPVSWL